MSNQLTANQLAAPVSHKQLPMLMAPAKSRIIFQGIDSRSSISRMPVIKNKMVETRIMPVLSKISRAGMKERRDITAMQLNTMVAAIISLRVKGPNSALRRFALSRNPGIVFFSGLKKTIKNPHRRKVISQPTGNM